MAMNLVPLTFNQLLAMPLNGLASMELNTITTLGSKGEVWQSEPIYLIKPLVAEIQVHQPEQKRVAL